MRIVLKNGSGVVDLKFLMEHTDRHGVVRMYFRRKGFALICLEEEVGSDEFMVEYNAALKQCSRDGAAPKLQPQPAARDTIGWLIPQYFEHSAHFKSLGESTRKVRRRQLDAFAENHGTKRYTKLERKHIDGIIEKMADTPQAANNLLKALRKVFQWAVKMEYLKFNPTFEAERLETDSSGHHTWTIEEVLRFMARHPANTKAGLAFALLWHLGPRRSDVVKLGRQMETRDGGIRWTEVKGRKKKAKVTYRKIEEELRAVLDMHASDDHLHYLVTEFGKPFSANGFGNWFRDRCDEASLFHCSAHGVRKGGATWAAENGATASQLQAMYNWCDLKEPSRYTAEADRKKLAEDGSKFVRLPDQKSNKSA